MSEFVVNMYADYGAPELKRNYQKFLLRGLAAASLLMLSGVGTYWGSIYLGREEEPKVMVRILKYTDLGPPPSIQSSSAPAVAVAAPSVKPSVGIPVPVPDAEINPEQTIATQTEMSQTVGEGDITGGGDIKIEDEGPPPDFVPFEKEPVAIKKVNPAYPEIARRAGVEGTVWMKVWVDKEGKVRRAEVLKSDADIFNQPAVDAAIQWVFTPALMKSGPVSVWVSIPFRFKLQGN